MSERRRHIIWAWVIHTPWVLAVLCILAIVGFFGSGAGNPLIRRLAIQRIESITGRDVEIRTVSIRWLAMGVTLKGLVIRRQRTGEHRAVICGGRSARRTARRFVLGAQSFAERFVAERTARAFARREKWRVEHSVAESHAGRAARKIRRHRFWHARATRSHRRRLGFVQRCQNADGRRRRRFAVRRRSRAARRRGRFIPAASIGNHFNSRRIASGRFR